MLRHDFFLLKRNATFESHPFCRNWVLKLQFTGMQQQAGGFGYFFGRGVQGIAQNGVPNGHHMKTELMGSTGNGFQLNSGGVIKWQMTFDTPLRVTWFALFPVYFASGSVGPIDDQRQLNVVPGF
jgi:hypothetical protein